MQDPQSLHKYAYVHGDPVNGVDPTGLSFLSDLGNIAHSQISRLHRLAHPSPKYVVTYDRGIPGTFGLRRPDIMNYTDGQIGEIKPLSTWGITNGYAQLIAAINIANGIGFHYGGKWIGAPAVPHAGPQADWIPSKWDPGIRVLTPGILDYRFNDFAIVTLGTWRGVTFYYRVRKPRTVQLAEFAAEATAAAARALAKVGADEVGRLRPNDLETVDTLIQIDKVLFTVVTAGVIYGVLAGASASSLGRAMQGLVSFRASFARASF